MEISETAKSMLQKQEKSKAGKIREIFPEKFTRIYLEFSFWLMLHSNYNSPFCMSDARN